MPTAKPKVLVIDDSTDLRPSLSAVVQSAGAECLFADDPLQGIQTARQQDIAILILDLQSPVLDGFEATRLLRAGSRTAHTPVLMLSEVRVGLADQRYGLDFGAVSYHARSPLDGEALSRQLQLLLDLQRRATKVQGHIHGFLDDTARLAQDNDQVRALQEGLHRHLLLDPLTGLPNLMYFALHLDIALKRAARGGKAFAVAWMDLDYVQRINERHGRDAGDAMLLAVAERMEQVVRTSDVLARVAGGTYGILLDGVTNAAETGLALQKILAAAGETLDIRLPKAEPLTLIPTLSIGVAIYPRHGKDRTTLLHRAEAAAREVGTAGGDGIRVGFGSELSG